MVGDANEVWRDDLIELWGLGLFALWADKEAGDDVAHSGRDRQQAEQPNDLHDRIDGKWNLFDDVWRQLQYERG